MIDNNHWYTWRIFCTKITERTYSSFQAFVTCDSNYLACQHNYVACCLVILHVMRNTHHIRVIYDVALLAIEYNLVIPKYCDGACCFSWPLTPGKWKIQSLIVISIKSAQKILDVPMTIKWIGWLTNWLMTVLYSTLYWQHLFI